MTENPAREMLARATAAQPPARPSARTVLAVAATAAAVVVTAVPAAAGTSGPGLAPAAAIHAPVLYVANVNVQPTGTLTPISTATNKPGSRSRSAGIPSRSPSRRTARPPTSPTSPLSTMAP